MEESKKYLLQIYLTSICSFRCEYCNVYDNSKVDEELNFNQLQKILDDFKLLNYDLSIFIYGGEPFQSNQLIETVNFLTNSRNNLKISIQTNGYNLSKFEYFLNPVKVKLKLSFHSTRMTWSIFKKVCIRYSKHLESISIMTDLNNYVNLEESIKYYRLLLKIFDIDIIFAPIINMNQIHNNYKIDDKFLKELINNSNYHNLIHDNGFSFYDIWNQFGPYITRNNNVPFNCTIRDNQMELYNNHIYRCEHFRESESGISLDNFNLRDYLTLSNKCEQTKCLFFNSCFHKEIVC